MVEFGSNYANARVGKDEWAEAEADESDEVFKLKLYSITSNIDYEHMDYYKNIKNLHKNLQNLLIQYFAWKSYIAQMIKN